MSLAILKEKVFESGKYFTSWRKSVFPTKKIVKEIRENNVSK
jgi:hypothetical protein